MKADHGWSGPPADFPPDAAEAEPLRVALFTHSDRTLLAQYVEARDAMQRAGQRLSDPRHRHRLGNPLRRARGESRVDLRELAATWLSLWHRIRADFIGKLVNGELTAWGRSGSRAAPPREVPATAWKKALRIEDPEAGTAFGPGLTLFDLHVGRRVAVPPSAEPPAASPKEQPASAARRRAAHSIAAQKRLQQWLEERMRASPDTPVSKFALKREARDAGLEFSQQGFKRAFPAAVEATGAVAWSAPGRKPTRHIDMPN